MLFNKIVLYHQCVLCLLQESVKLDYFKMYDYGLTTCQYLM